MIETTHSQKRISCGRQVTGPSQVQWVLVKVGSRTTLKASVSQRQSQLVFGITRILSFGNPLNTYSDQLDNQILASNVIFVVYI